MSAVSAFTVRPVRIGEVGMEHCDVSEAELFGVYESTAEDQLPRWVCDCGTLADAERVRAALETVKRLSAALKSYTPIYADLWRHRIVSLDERHPVWHSTYAEAQSAADAAISATGVEHWPFEPPQSRVDYKGTTAPRDETQKYVVARGTVTVRS